MKRVAHKTARSVKSAGKSETDLFAAFLSLKDGDEVRRFLRDLCTPKEIADLADRWRVAKLLEEGSLSYRAIQELTGVSVTTVGRVARFLQHEDFGGYRLVLARAKS